MGWRRRLSRFTSPFFVPLRRLVVWSDQKFGTCDMKLSLEPRYNSVLDGFADMDDSSAQISELMKKVSKDQANLVGLGQSEEE